MIVATEPEIERAFAAWERDVRDNPDGFLGAEAQRAEPLDTAAVTYRKTFLHYLGVTKAAFLAPRG